MRVGFKNKGGRGPIDPATGERIGARQAAMNSMLAGTSPEAGLSSVPTKTISPEDITEFRRLGVNPGLRTTMQEDYDRLAYSQRNTEVWTRGISSFVGKTAMYTVGGVIGGFYGLGSAVANLDASKMWDNKFSNAMTDAEEWMDDRMKIHMSSEVQEANFLQSLGASSFWARDVLGGLAFTAGAILSELTIGALTAGLGTAARIPSIVNKVDKAVKWGRKIFKIGKKAEDALTTTAKVEDAISAAQNLSRINAAQNLMKDAALVSRRMLTGAGFESGVEAIHFRKEALDNWVKQYQEANNGALPSEEEYLKMADAVAKTGNAIYAANMMTVGLSNFATLGKIFRKGITSNQMLLKNSSSFYGKQVPKMFGGLAPKAVKAAKTRTGERLFKSNYNNLFKGLGYTAAIFKNPLIEGVFEEGLQGTYNKTGLDYIQSMYNEDAKFNLGDLLSHFGEGLAQTYNTKEGWKEIGIGMLIGGLGVPGRRWQGGIVGEILDMKDNIKEADELAKRLNESQSKINILADHMAAMQQAAAEEDAAIEDGDIFRAKTAEDQQIFSTLAMRHETGFMQEFLEDFDETIDSLTLEDFQTKFGYENITEEQLTNRKEKLKKDIRDKSASVQKAYDVSLSMITPDDMSDEAQRNIQRAAAFMAYNIEEYGKREEQLAKEINEMVDIPLNDKALKNLHKLYRYGEQRLNWIINYYVPTIRKAKEAKDPAEVERLTKKKEELEKKLHQTLKARELEEGISKKEYDRDVERFMNDIEETANLMGQLLEIEADDAVVAPNLQRKVKDLQRVGYERQSFIDQLRLLRTDAGMEAASNDVLDMMAKSERFNRTLMGMIAKIGGMQMLEEARKNNKTLSSRQLLKQLYASMGAQLGQDISDAPRGDNAIEQLQDLSSAKLGDPSELTELKKQVVGILNSLGENRQANITKLEQLQKFLEDYRETPEFAAIKSMRDTELINEYIDQAIDLINPAIEEQKEINAQEKQAKKEEKERIGARVFWRIKDLFKVVSKENKESLWEKVKGVPASELKNRITFRYTDAADTSIADTSNPNVKIQRGIEGKNILVFIDGEQVGGLTSPTQFIVNDQPIDYEAMRRELESDNLEYSKSILRELNSDWVDLEDPKVATQMLVSLYDMHQGLLNKFQDTTEIPFPEDIIDSSEFATSGISTSIEYLEEKIPFSELSNELRNASIIEYNGEQKHVIFRTEVSKGRNKVVREIYTAPIDNLDQATKLERGDEYDFYLEKLDDVMQDNRTRLYLVNTPYLMLTQAADKFGIITAGLSSYKQSFDLKEGLQKLIIDDMLPAIAEYFENNKDTTFSDLEQDEVPIFKEFFITTSKGANVFVNVRASRDGEIFYSVNQPTTGANLTHSLNAYYDYDSKTFRFYPLPRAKNKESTRNQLRDWNEESTELTLKERQDGKIEILNNYSPSQSNVAYGERLSPDILLRNLAGEEGYTLESRIKKNDKFKVPDDFKIYRVTNSPRIEENENNQFDLTPLEAEADVHMAMFFLPEGAFMANVNEFDYNIWQKRTNKKEEKKETTPAPKEEKAPLSNKAIENIVVRNDQIIEMIEDSKSSKIPIENVKKNIEKVWKDYFEEKNIEDVDALYETIREETESLIDEIYDEQETSEEISDEAKDALDTISILEKQISEVVDRRDNLRKKVRNKEITKDEYRDQVQEIEQELRDLEDEASILKQQYNQKFATKISDLDIQSRIDINLAITRLQRILPQIPVKDLETLAFNIKTKGALQGLFKDGIIYLSENAEQGVEYHEAFHAVFRLLLSPEEINRYLSFAKRHYGKPDNLSEIMKIHNVSRSEAADIWYEEKMADDFQKYASGQKDRLPNLLQRLWEKILRWLGIIRDNDLDKLFTSIYRGKYANVENKYSAKRKGFATSLIKTTSKLQGNKFIDRYLDAGLTNSIVGTVASKVQTKKTIDIFDIKEELFELSDKLENFAIDYSSEFSDSEANMIWNRVDDLKSALRSQANLDDITRMVVDKVSFLKSYEETTDDAGTEEDAEKESWQQAPNEIGGYSSASKRLRHYLSLITTQRNIFGVSKRSWETFTATNPDVDLHMAVDERLLYNNLLKTLQGVPKYKMLDQLIAMRNIDENMSVFVNKVLADIANDLNVDIDVLENMSDSLSRGDYIKRLERSNTYNFITSSLRKDRMMHFDINFDPTRKNPKMFNANSKSAGFTQIELWRANAEAKFSIEDDHSKVFEAFEQSEYLNRNAVSLRAIEAIRDNKFDQYIDEVRSAWDSVGIDLERQYVEYSIIETLINRTKQTKTAYDRKLSEAQQNKLDNYYRWYEKHQNVDGIYEDEDSLNSIREGISAARKHDQFNIFLNTSRKTTDQLQFGEYSKVLGVTSSIRGIARANALFNPIIIPSVFQNQEGQNQYDIIDPNYQTETIAYFKDRDNIQFLTDIIENNISINDGAIKLVNNDVFPGMFTEIEPAKRWLTAIMFNPLLQRDREYLLSPEFQVAILGGLKTAEYEDGFLKKYGDNYERDGVTWKKASPADKLLMVLSMFDTSNSENLTEAVYNDQSYVFYRPGVPSDASMVPLIRMAKRKLYSKGKLMEEAREDIDSIVAQEESRIDSTLNEIQKIKSGAKTDNISENFHYVIKDGKKIFYDGTEYFTMVDGEAVSMGLENNADNFNTYAPRGLKFWNFAKLGDIQAYYYINQPADYSLDPFTFLESQAEDFINLLAQPDIGLIAEANIDNLKEQLNKLNPKLRNNKTRIKNLESKIKSLEAGEIVYNAINIPREFMGEDNSVNISAIKNFYYNDFINSYSYYNLMFGDNAFVAKDATDWVKRLKGANAAGNDYGNGVTRFMTVRDEQFSFEEDHPYFAGTSPIERADGQTRSTVGWYKDVIIASEGNLTTEVRDILERIEMGYEISASESNILADNQAETQPSKTVGFDASTYIKTSIAPILRSEVSYLKGSRKELDNLYKQLFKEKRKISPSQEKITDLYTKIHSQWEAIPGSEYLHNMLNTMEMNSVDLLVYDTASKRNKTDILEVENNNLTEILPHTISNKFLRNQVKTHGFKNEIVDGTQKLGLIWSEQNASAVAYFLNKKVKIGDVITEYEKLQAKRVRQGLSFLRDVLLDGDKAQYKILMSSFKASAEAANISPNLLAYFDVNALGEPVHDINTPSVVSKVEAMFLAFASNQVLKHKAPGHKLSLISDHGYTVHRNKSGNVIPRRTIKNKLESGQSLSSTQDRLRMRDNQIEVVVSERFLHEHNLTLGESIPENLLLMHGIRIPTQDKHSMGIFKIVDVMPANMGNGIIVPPEVTYLSGSDFDIDALYVRVKAFFKKNNKIITYGDYRNAKTLDEAIDAAFIEYVEDAKSNKKFKALKKLIEDEDVTAFKGVEMSKRKALSAMMMDLSRKRKKLLSDYYSSDADTRLAMRNGKTSFDAPSKAEKAILKIKNELERIDEEIIKLTLDTLGLKSDKKSFSKEFKSQIKSNMKATFPEPITISELNNYMLDMEMSLTINEGNEKVATTPASRKIFVDMYDVIYKKNNIPDPTETNAAHDVTSKTQADAATSIGQENIGIAAVFNIVLQRLVKNKQKLENVELFGKNTFTLTSDNLEFERVNDIVSSFISAMTDNQKNNDAGKFNLSTETINYALLLAGLGIDPKVIMYIMASKDMNTTMKILRSKKSILSRNKFVSKKDLVAEQFPELSDVEPYEGELTPELMDSFIKKDNDIETDMSDELYQSIRSLMLDNYLNSIEINDYIFNYSRIIQLIKGVSKDFESVEKIHEHLANLGFEYDEGLIQTKDELPLTNMEEYLNNELIGANLEAWGDILSMSKKFFLSQTDFFKDTIRPLDKITRNGYDALKQQLLVYTAATAFKHQNPEYADADFYQLLTEQETSPLQDNIVEAIRRHPNNRFLKFLGFDFRNYLGDQHQNKQFYGKTIALIKGGVRTIKDPAYLASLADGFNELATSDNPKDTQLASDLIKYLLVKDGFLFNNDTFIQHINPNFLISLSESGKSALAAFNEDRNFEATFGLNKSQFKDNFFEMFARYIGNNGLFGGYSYLNRGQIQEQINALTTLDETKKLKFISSPDDNRSSYTVPIQFNTKKEGDKYILDLENINNEEVSTLYVNPFLGKLSKKERSAQINFVRRNFGLSRFQDGRLVYDFYGRITFYSKGTPINKNLIAKSFSDYYDVDGTTYWITFEPNGRIISMKKKGSSKTRTDIKYMTHPLLKEEYNEKNLGGQMQAMAAEYRVQKYISTIEILPYGSGMEAFESYKHVRKDKKLTGDLLSVKQEESPKENISTEAPKTGQRTDFVIEGDTYNMPSDPTTVTEADLNYYMAKYIENNPLLNPENGLVRYFLKSINSETFTDEVMDKIAYKFKPVFFKSAISMELDIKTSRDKFGANLSQYVFKSLTVEKPDVLKRNVEKMMKDLSSDKSIIESEAPSVTIQQAESILDKLSSKFNIPWKFDESINALGMFYKGEVLINPNRFRQDTLFHEFAHPFVKVIAQTNPLLYKTLSDEIQNSDIYKDIQRRYIPEDGFTEQDIIEESIVQAIGLAASNQLNEPKLLRLIKTLLKRIAQALGINISQLPENLTIDDIATLMLSDQVIDLQAQSIDGFEEVC